MQDRDLLLELLECEYADDAVGVLFKRGLFDETQANRWIPVGKMRNNQSVVQAQMSSPAAALVEKFTNGLDAILLRRCKADGHNPRGVAAPDSMVKAVQRWFGDLSVKTQAEIRAIAEENLVLYATGAKQRPCIS